MIVLGLDASAGGAGAAIADADGLRAMAWAGRGARPAASLLALAGRALEEAGMTARDLRGIAVTVGPGSYAGVRAAVMTGKALAHAAGLPLAAVGSLETLARAAGPWPGVAWAAIDARRGRVYAAAYRWEAGCTRVLWDAALLERSVFRDAVAASGAGPRLLVGTGVSAEDVDALGGSAAGVWLGARGAPAAMAGAVALRGRERLSAGEADDPIALLPLYAGEPDIGRAPRVPGRDGPARG